MKQEKFTIEEVQEISDRTCHSTGTGTGTGTSTSNRRELRAYGNITPNVVIVPEARHRIFKQDFQSYFKKVSKIPFALRAINSLPMFKTLEQLL